MQLPQLLWFAEHHPYAIGHVALSNQAWPLHAFALLYLLLLLQVSSLGEDEFPSVLPPAHARGLLALAERPVHLQRAGGEKGAVGFRSPGLYRVGRGSHKSTSPPVPPLFDVPQDRSRHVLLRGKIESQSLLVCRADTPGSKAKSLCWSAHLPADHKWFILPLMILLGTLTKGRVT